MIFKFSCWVQFSISWEIKSMLSWSLLLSLHSQKLGEQHYGLRLLFFFLPFSGPFSLKWSKGHFGGREERQSFLIKSLSLCLAVTMRSLLTFQKFHFSLPEDGLRRPTIQIFHGWLLRAENFPPPSTHTKTPMLITNIPLPTDVTVFEDRTF